MHPQKRSSLSKSIAARREVDRQPQWFHTQNPSAVSSGGNYHLHIQPGLTGQGVLLQLPCQHSVQVKPLPKVAGAQWVRVCDQPSSHGADHILNNSLCSHRVRVAAIPWHRYEPELHTTSTTAWQVQHLPPQFQLFLLLSSAPVTREQQTQEGREAQEEGQHRPAHLPCCKSS